MPLWTYRAQWAADERPYVDGDSLWVRCDTGFYGRSLVEVRLVAVSAPELDEPGGPECAAFVRQWLTDAAAVGARWPLVVTTVPDRSQGYERRTFTRYLATVSRTLDAAILNVDVGLLLADHPDWPRGL